MPQQFALKKQVKIVYVTVELSTVKEIRTPRVVITHQRISVLMELKLPRTFGLLTTSTTPSTRLVDQPFSRQLTHFLIKIRDVIVTKKINLLVKD
jgi:hypothetical protein